MDGKVADENVFPPAARVSAEARDEKLVPTTFESSVVKLNCSDGGATVSFMGISRSELFQGFYRCIAK